MTACNDSGISISTGITPRDRLRAIEYTADTILNAAHHNIKVVALDNSVDRKIRISKDENALNASPEPAFKAFLSDFVEFAKKSPHFNPQISTINASAIGMFERKTDFLEQFAKHPAIQQYRQSIDYIYDTKSFKRRNADDIHVALDISKIVESGGKILVNYGQAHVYRERNDIDSWLQYAKISTKVIHLYGNTSDFINTCEMSEDKKTDGCESLDADDKVFLKEGIIDKSKTENKNPQQFLLKDFNL